MNSVVITGYLTKDPEKVDGQALCKMTVAVKNNYRNKDGEYDSEFLNVAVWNRLHEHCMKYLSKGSKVLVAGELHIRNYEKDGVKKYVTEIVAHDVEFLSTKQEPKMTPINEEDLPF